ISYKHVEPWGFIGASGLIVVDGDAAYLIDTPWTTKATNQLIEWIEDRGLVLKSAIVTHFHEDASGDLPLLNDLKVNTYATSLTNQLLKLNNKEISNTEISSNELKIFNGIATVYYPGPGHTEDNIVVWLPNEKLLFGGCFVKSLRNKSLGYTGDANIGEWSNSIQRVLQRYPDIVTVVPGHGQVGDVSLLLHTQKLASSDKTSDK
ncbi:VAM family subclass B1 metallo-beta-lactamase, partial [Vibrio parahaemolyticus]|nr:VAM family subclass B1 metallo-beta-lactamase [Vibrio parahaemolyticus]